MNEPTFSRRIQRMLAEFPKLKDDLPDLILECGQGGALIEEMDQFLRSLGGRLKRKFGLYGWQHHFEKGEFRVCSGAVPAFEGGVRQFRGCKTMNSIDAFSESRLPGTWTRWN